MLSKEFLGKDEEDLRLLAYSSRDTQAGTSSTLRTAVSTLSINSTSSDNSSAASNSSAAASVVSVVPASNPEVNMALIGAIEESSPTEVQKALKASALVKEKNRLSYDALCKWCLNLPYHSDGYEKRTFSKQDMQASFQILQALLKAGARTAEVDTYSDDWSVGYDLDFFMENSEMQNGFRYKYLHLY
jgi:hypothetical protein